MALTQNQQTQIVALIQQEGFQQFFTEASAAYIASQQTATMSTLSAAITVTVSDWATLAAYVTAASTSNVALYSILDAINTAAQAKDASKLGPLFVALFAANKANFNK
jgi:hypothetical protein